MWILKPEVLEGDVTWEATAHGGLREATGVDKKRTIQRSRSQRGREGGSSGLRETWKKVLKGVGSREGLLLRAALGDWVTCKGSVHGVGHGEGTEPLENIPEAYQGNGSQVQAGILLFFSAGD